MILSEAAFGHGVENEEILLLGFYAVAVKQNGLCLALEGCMRECLIRTIRLRVVKSNILHP